MASVNSVTIIGNLGRDPEIRYLPSGDAIANIAVATSYKYKDKQTGEAKEQTEWHRITFFGKMAEIVGQYMKKGSSIYVQGRLQTRKYQKDGVDHYATDIVAENMQFLDKRPEGQAAPAPAARQQAPAPTQQTQGQRQQANEMPWDDVPFAVNIMGASVQTTSRQLMRAQLGRCSDTEF